MAPLVEHRDNNAHAHCWTSLTCLAVGSLFPVHHRPQAERLAIRNRRLSVRTSKNSVNAKFGTALIQMAQDSRRGDARSAGGPVKGKGEKRGPPERCDTPNPTTAKRAAPLPADHNHLYQVAISPSALSAAPMGQESHKRTALPERYYEEVRIMPRRSRYASRALIGVRPGPC